MDRIIGIGEFTISKDENDTLKTFALASCVAVTAYCAEKKVGGMIHIALPRPFNDQVVKPAYYATTGIPLFINNLCNEYGCMKNSLTIQIYGGANSINQKDVFQVGKRNLEEVKRILSLMQLRIYKEETGGTVSRTIELNNSTGEIKMSILPMKI